MRPRDSTLRVWLCPLLLLPSAFFLRASLALGQERAFSPTSHLSAEVRDRLTKAALDPTLESWQRSFMLEVAQSSPAPAAAESSQAAPGIALPLAGSAPEVSSGLAVFPADGRHGHSVIYDPVRQRMVVFAGADGGSHDDVWALSLSGSPSWIALAPVGIGPSARQGHTAIYDPARERMVIFGGVDGYSRIEAWTLSLSGSPTWSGLIPAGLGPSQRKGHTAIYDPVRERMVLFGGMDEFGSRNDVWGLSLSGDPVWSALTPAGRPPSARYGHTAIYDPVRDRMVVFGGYDANTGSCGDVWTLSLSGNAAWSQLSTAGGGPNARHGHTAIYQPGLDRMVVVGGNDGYNSRSDAWALSLSGKPAWSKLTKVGSPPAARNAHTAIYDAAGNRMIVFGGMDATTLNDAWALSLQGSPAWSALSPAARPATAKAHHAWPFMIGLDGGLAVPGGKFADRDRFNAASGYQFGGSLEHMITPKIGLGVDGSYVKNPRNKADADPTVASIEDEYTTVQFGVYARLFLFMAGSPHGLWALIGVGGYSLTEKWTVTYDNGAPPSNDEGNDKTGVRPGGKIGLGANFKLSKQMSVGVGADYNLISLNADKTDENFEFADFQKDVSSFQYFGIRAGVTYHVGSK